MPMQTINHQSNLRSGTAGGLLLSMLLDDSSALVQSAMNAAVGATVSFFLSLLLSRLLKGKGGKGQGGG